MPTPTVVSRGGPTAGKTVLLALAVVNALVFVVFWPVALVASAVTV